MVCEPSVRLLKVELERVQLAEPLVPLIPTERAVPWPGAPAVSMKYSAAAIPEPLLSVKLALNVGE
jgi:hypothetical protein